MASGTPPLDSLEAEHTPAAIRRRLREGHQPSYLRDFIYGAIDGAVTTFAVVSGVAGADLSSGIVLVLGFANLIADGFSMAASNFLGVRADEQSRERIRAIEHDHIARHPAGETEEIRQIFREKGFADADLERAVEIITANERRWVDTMITEEYGLALDGPRAGKAAATTFVAFVLVGFIPLAPFLFGVENAFTWSAVLTGVSFFAVGAWKSRFVLQGWLMAGLETLALGGGAAVLAYLTGAALKGLAG